MHRYPVLILETHLDTYGHVNNATYLQIYEEARWDLISSKGYGLKKIHDSKIGPIVLEVNLKFLKEIQLRETITVVSEMLSYTGKISQMKQQMLREDGTVLSEAIFTIALFDLKARKLILPTPEWKHAIGLES